MIVFVQPYGLKAHGGGARILRSLLADAPARYAVVNTSPWSGAAAPPADEIALRRRPSAGRLDFSRVVRLIAYGERLFGGRFKARLADTCRGLGASAIHAIPHGPDFWWAYEVARDLGIPYVLYVHDDLPYNLPKAYLGWAMERLGDAWRGADARFVISEPMGEAYDARYGVRPYRVVTDGLEAVRDAPRPRVPGRLKVYLMGSIHLSYEKNFKELVAALASIRADRPDLDVGLVIRGGWPFASRNIGVPVEVRSWGTQAEVLGDLDDVDLLYLPLPFDDEHATFVRYSLATKLVTYVGTGLPIVYHGPRDAAAALLLRDHGAGALATELSADNLARTLVDAADRGRSIADGALKLARDRFLIDDQRNAFWGDILPLLGAPAAAELNADRVVISQ